MEIELVVMAGLEFERHAEPGVVGGVADLEMGDGVCQMATHNLLPNGMTVLQLADGAVIACLLQAADELGFAFQSVSHADVGIDQAIGIKDGATERSTAECNGSATHEGVFAGRAFGREATPLFHHAAACTSLAEAHARPHRQALPEGQLEVAESGSFHDA